MKVLAALFLLVGISVVIALVAWQGAHSVANVLRAGGWLLLWLVPNYVFLFFLDTLSWQPLLAGRKLPFRVLYYTNWIGSAVNWLLPVAQIGGEVVRMRYLMHRGVQATDAAATMVVDKTVQALTMVVFALIAVGMLVVRAGDVPVTGGVLVFALLVTAGIFLFYWLQQRGLFTLISRLAPRARMPERALRLADGAAALDAAIRASYRARRALAAAVLWRMVFRLAVTGEVYLALHFMGQPAGFAECFILQNLGQAVRSAAFLVPAGLGVQEGGYLLLAMALGLRPDVGLALSLAKRFRELVVGVPGLLAWQFSEVRRFRPGASGGNSAQSG